VKITETKRNAKNDKRRKFRKKQQDVKDIEINIEKPKSAEDWAEGGKKIGHEEGRRLGRRRAEDWAGGGQKLVQEEGRSWYRRRTVEYWTGEQHL
jgi:hypothetical protein